jgi:hypothetical protein
MGRACKAAKRMGEGSNRSRRTRESRSHNELKSGSPEAVDLAAPYYKAILAIFLHKIRVLENRHPHSLLCIVMGSPVASATALLTGRGRRIGGQQKHVGSRSGSGQVPEGAGARCPASPPRLRHRWCSPSPLFSPGPAVASLCADASVCYLDPSRRLRRLHRLGAGFTFGGRKKELWHVNEMTYSGRRRRVDKIVTTVRLSG